jgi:hypothetical protein
MRANDLPLVAQAVPPANYISSHLLTLGALMESTPIHFYVAHPAGEDQKQKDVRGMTLRMMVRDVPGGGGR